MRLLLSVLMWVAVVQLSSGDQPVEEVITAEKVPLLGGWSVRDAESEQVLDAAEHAVKLFNSQLKGRRLFKLLSVTSAQSQVTNMINYKIEAVLAKTKCLKSESHNLDTCGLARKRLQCSFDVAFDPRHSKYELQSHKCTKSLNNGQ
ncbi:cystatin-C [Neosynchiropus ocellatus]